LPSHFAGGQFEGPDSGINYLGWVLWDGQAMPPYTLILQFPYHLRSLSSLPMQREDS
jgi:hypothetical protein